MEQRGGKIRAWRNGGGIKEVKHEGKRGLEKYGEKMQTENKDDNVCDGKR